MMQTQAIVIRVDGQEALVEATQGGGCGNCDKANGCGSSKLSQLFCSEPRRFTVRNEGDVQVGAIVQVTLPEGVLLHSALLMYIFPLVFLLLGAILGAQWQSEAPNSDAYSALGGFVGLSLGFLLVKWLSLRRRLTSTARPVILPPTEKDYSL